MGPSVNIVKQQEVKRDPIVSGEKIQIGFALNVVRESRTFQATVRAKTAEDSGNYFGDCFYLCVTHSVLTSTTEVGLSNRNLINLCFE